MTPRLVTMMAVAVGLAGCGPEVPPPPESFDLLATNRVASWRSAGIPNQGTAEVRSGRIRISDGQPMSGIRFAGDWETLQLPVTDYRLRYQARRTEGQDFFATCTFPVGSLERCVSLVVGGWGGTVVGISSINYLDASQNNTRGEMPFENDRWYDITIEVREEDLRVWIDQKPMVNVSIKGHHLDLRHGDIDQTAPLGFATWRSASEIRGLSIERL